MPSPPLPPGITRREIPLLGDIVTISTPAHLRLLNTHPDIARPDAGRLPPLLTHLLSATQFYTPSPPAYTLAFTTTAQNAQKSRRARVLANLAPGFTPAQVAALAAIVRSDLPKHPAARQIAALLGPRVLGLPPGAQIPADILDCMRDMDLNYILNPLQYLRARAARAKVQAWAAAQFPAERHVVDVAHDLLTLYQGFTAGLLGLRAMESDDLAAHLGRNPILPLSLRVPSVTTTVGGLFPDEAPLVKDRTVVVMDNGAAAKETLDLAFVFGMGTEKRQCPFRGLFMETCEKILEDGRPGAGAVRVEAVARMG